MPARVDGNLRRYILSPGYALRGWKLLPYAVQHPDPLETLFFREHEWELLKACDGQTDIDWDRLPEADRRRYGSWEKRGLIRFCDGDAALEPAQRYRFYRSRFKESVQWSVTGKCNYNCRHCFMSAPHAAQGEPTWEQLMTMLEAFHRCGIKGLNLTGGEPAVRRDFWRLVDEILKRGMVIPYLYSNGLLITDEFLEELTKRDLHPTIQFSFDGAGYHDWMRGVGGAEKAVLEAMRRCRDRGFRFGAAMVLFKENKDSIRESVNLLSETGCAYLKICNAWPQGEWKNQPEHYLMQQQVFQTFLDYIPCYFEDGRPLTIVLDGFFNYFADRGECSSFFEKNVEEKDFPGTMMCGHTRRREMYVSPGGNVLPCMGIVGHPLEEKFPNMLETPLEEILDGGSPYMDIVNYRVSDYMAHNPDCRACEYRTACCGGCRAVALQGGSADYLAKDPVACEYFRGGWKERKDAVLKRIGQI